MGIKTLAKQYKIYKDKCKKQKIKPMSYIDFIIEMES